MPITLSEFAASISPSPIMVGFGDDGPCDRATRLRIPHTGFGRRFALGPCHGTTHPRMHRATLGNPILAGDSGSADVRPNGVHTVEIFNHGRRRCTISPLIDGMTMRSGNSRDCWSNCSCVAASTCSGIIPVPYIIAGTTVVAPIPRVLYPTVCQL